MPCPDESSLIMHDLQPMTLYLRSHFDWHEMPLQAVTARYSTGYTSIMRRKSTCWCQTVGGHPAWQCMQTYVLALDETFCFPCPSKWRQIAPAGGHGDKQSQPHLLHLQIILDRGSTISYRNYSGLGRRAPSP